MKCRWQRFLAHGLTLWMLVLSTSWSYQHQHLGGEDLHGHCLGLVDFSRPSAAESAQEQAAHSSHSHVLFLGIELGGGCLPCLPRVPGDPSEEVPVSLAPEDTLIPDSVSLVLEQGPASPALPPVTHLSCSAGTRLAEPTAIPGLPCPAAQGARSGVLLI